MDVRHAGVAPSWHKSLGPYALSRDDLRGGDLACARECIAGVAYTGRQVSLQSQHRIQGRRLAAAGTAAFEGRPDCRGQRLRQPWVVKADDERRKEEMTEWETGEGCDVRQRRSAAAKDRPKNKLGTAPIFAQRKWDCPLAKSGSCFSASPKLSLAIVAAAAASRGGSFDKNLAAVAAGRPHDVSPVLWDEVKRACGG